MPKSVLKLLQYVSAILNSIFCFFSPLRKKNFVKPWFFFRFYEDFFLKQIINNKWIRRFKCCCCFLKRKFWMSLFQAELCFIDTSQDTSLKHKLLECYGCAKHGTIFMSYASVLSPAHTAGFIGTPQYMYQSEWNMYLIMHMIHITGYI